MKIIDIIKISFSNLFRQKLRTFLTITSIVIGAMLISIVYAIIPGIDSFLNVQLNTLSTDNYVEVFASDSRPGSRFLDTFASGPQEYSEEESTSEGFFANNFTDADIENIEAIDGVVKYYDFSFVNAEYVLFKEKGGRYAASQIFYYPTFLLQNLELVSGRLIREGEDRGKVVVANDYVAALGYDSADDLIGKKIMIHAKQSIVTDDVAAEMTALETQQRVLQEKDFEFEIIGVTEKTILSSVIFIPYEDMKKMLQFTRNTENIFNDKDRQRFMGIVEIEDKETADQILEEIESLGFSGQTAEEEKNTLNQLFDVLNVIFSSFGVLAMAVASLGIVNTLIMAVYERTREIGVMKAVGATKRNIAMLFTIEAMFIGLIGGVIGLAFGFGIAEILNYIGHRTILENFATLDLSTISPLLFIAPVISTVVSTIAGIYPAVRASRLDPVEALRYE